MFVTVYIKPLSHAPPILINTMLLLILIMTMRKVIRVKVVGFVTVYIQPMSVAPPNKAPAGKREVISVFPLRFDRNF